MKLLPVLLVLSVLVSGCTSSSTPGQPQQEQKAGQPAAQIEATSVVELTTILARAKNWDTDPENDGIEVIISPKGINGNLVKADGKAGAKLWQALYDQEGNRIHGQLIQQWDNVAVSQGMFDDYGAKLLFDFRGFSPKPNEFAFFQTVLTTPDGSSFAAKETLVALRFA